MILATIDMPDEKRSVIMVVIEPENLERMKKADPVSLESLKTGGMLQPVAFPLNMSLLIAYEEDHDTLVALAGRGNRVLDFVHYLERGRKFIEGVDGVQHTVPIAGKSAEPQG